jgi:polyisoprenoid-binding protein YceI
MIRKTTIILVLALAQYVSFAQQRYVLDVKNSKLSWKVETMGKHFGYLLFNNGILNYSAKDKPVNGNFTLNMNEIRSMDNATQEGRKKIDDKLKWKDFFDVKNYPTGRVVIKQIIKTNNPIQFKVLANLTIKGLTHSIEFIANIRKNKEVINATGQLTINRTYWNINHHPKPSNVLSYVQDKIIPDDILINLNLVFRK